MIGAKENQTECESGDSNPFGEIYDPDSIDQYDDDYDDSYRPFKPFDEGCQIDDVSRTILMPDFVG